MSRRILIIDDNPTNLLLAATVLELEGYEILKAGSARQALDMMRLRLPDLILVDIAMPDVDGLTFTRQIKSDPHLRSIPVLALTAFAMKGDDEKARDAGCDGYITKPIDTRHFPALIARFLPPRPNVKKLLIVDDYPANNKLLRAQLEADGHQVLEAANGVEALNILETQSVDGIVSDILMPRMDGYSLCLAIRKSKTLRSLPIVLYTSTYNSPADRDLALNAGADAYVEKPAPTETILAALNSAASAGRSATSEAPEADAIETPVLRQYSEALVRKLEERSAELGRAYEGLAQTEARLAAMFEGALDAIIAVSERQEIVLFNGAAERMFGCTRAEALKRPLTEFIPQGVRRSQSASATSGTVSSGDRTVGLRNLWGLRRGGREFPVEASISKLNTAQGEITTIFLRDITDRYRAEQALARSEAALRQAQQLARLAHIVTGPTGQFESWSDNLGELIGSASSALPDSPRRWLELIHPEDRALFRRRAIHAARTGARTEFQYRIRGQSSWLHVHHVMEPVRAFAEDQSQPLRWFNTLQDISQSKDAELRFRRLNRVLSVLSGINSLIVRAADLDELLRESCRIVVEAGQFPKAWIGLVDAETSKLRFAAGHGATPPFYQSLQAMLADASSTGTSFAITALQELRPVVSNDLRHAPRVLAGVFETGSRSLAVLPLIIAGLGVGVLAIHAEVVGFFDHEEMKLLRELADDIAFALDHLRKAEHIQYLANYDPLTGLPNRRSFTDRLSQALPASNGAGTMPAVALLDLERFRRINETLGRPAGDTLLKLAAARLRQINPSVARIGVDTFAVEVRDRQTVADVARALEELSARCFAEPFNLSGEELRIGCRIGVAVFPVDGSDAETLLRNAEAALRRAKSSAEQYVFYAPDLNARAAEAMTMESKLRRAIERQEFVLYYQPKITLADRRICSVEALLRWQDPGGELVAPGHFIPILEESGLIGAVGEWALHQALADQQRWREAGLPATRVAVNVSPLQLRRPDFANLIERIVGSSPEARLELEITESTVMEQVERNTGALRQIRAAGVEVAIDDFGTGYSSLSYIARLPVTSLKIDRAFILGMTSGPEGLAIVSSIIALAHALKLTVVAEGVETEEQARLLHLLGCEEAQGFLFSRPLPFDMAAELLRRNAPMASH